LTDSPRDAYKEVALLLFIRLRAVLSEVCSDHPVAVCKTCGRAHKVEEFGTDIGKAYYLCHDCGADLRESLKAHAHTCPNLMPQKPLARVVSDASSSRPSVRGLAASRLEQDPSGSSRPRTASFRFGGRGYPPELGSMAACYYRRTARAADERLAPLGEEERKK
jgi:hypothetical protein